MTTYQTIIIIKTLYWLSIRLAWWSFS